MAGAHDVKCEGCEPHVCIGHSCVVVGRITSTCCQPLLVSCGSQLWVCGGISIEAGQWCSRSDSTRMWHTSKLLQWPTHIQHCVLFSLQEPMAAYMTDGGRGFTRELSLLERNAADGQLGRRLSGDVLEHRKSQDAARRQSRDQQQQ